MSEYPHTRALTSEEKDELLAVMIGFYIEAEGLGFLGEFIVTKEFVEQVHIRGEAVYEPDADLFRLRST